MGNGGRFHQSEIPDGRMFCRNGLGSPLSLTPCPSSRTLSLTGVDSDLVDWASDGFRDIDVCGDDINDNISSTKGTRASNTAITIEKNRASHTVTAPANGNDQGNLDNLKHAGEPRIIGTTYSQPWVYGTGRETCLELPFYSFCY